MQWCIPALISNWNWGSAFFIAWNECRTNRKVRIFVNRCTLIIAVIYSKYWTMFPSTARHPAEFWKNFSAMFPRDQLWIVIALHICSLEFSTRSHKMRNYQRPIRHLCTWHFSINTVEFWKNFSEMFPQSWVPRDQLSTVIRGVGWLIVRCAHVPWNSWQNHIRFAQLSLSGLSGACALGIFSITNTGNQYLELNK